MWGWGRGVLSRALGVEVGEVVVSVVEVDCFRVEQGEHLFVVSATGVGDHAGDVERAVDRPLELLRELRGSGVAVKLASYHHLRALVVGGSSNEELAFMDRGGFGRDGGVHLGANPRFGEFCKVGFAAV